jgi:biopolymer transport protein ExbD
MASIPSRPALLGEINTTPLIDVMLVLLVMMILSVPAATHSLDVELPNCGAACPDVSPDSLRNRVTLGVDDSLRWNGSAVTSQGLASLLERTRHFPVEPELQFEPAAGASYDATARTLRIIKASGVTKFGFVGNERYRDLLT